MIKGVQNPTCRSANPAITGSPWSAVDGDGIRVAPINCGVWMRLADHATGQITEMS